MTQLLVSVRDLAEACVAAQSGADLIDIKEPHAGSLGAATLTTIGEIAAQIDGQKSLSVALGELLDPAPFDFAMLPTGIRYAKVGLSGCDGISNWFDRWRAVIDILPGHVRPVAVVYADHLAARSPDADTVVGYASRLGCAAVLVDTWSKTNGPLSSYWSADRIRSFVIDVQRRNMLAVLGGGLDESLLMDVLKTEPDFVAVRGAVCGGSRTDRIDGARVCGLAKRIADICCRELIDSPRFRTRNASFA